MMVFEPLVEQLILIIPAEYVNFLRDLLIWLFSFL